MKPVVRILLLCCLLMLGKAGYQRLDCRAGTSVLSVQSSLPVSQSRNQLKAIEIEEENEDSKSPVSKKSVDPGCYFTGFTRVHEPAYHIVFSAHRLPFGQYSFYIAPEKHLVHRVIRV